VSRKKTLTGSAAILNSCIQLATASTVCGVFGRRGMADEALTERIDTAVSEEIVDRRKANANRTASVVAIRGNGISFGSPKAAEIERPRLCRA
jgi:hypothetical protein